MSQAHDYNCTEPYVWPLWGLIWEYEDRRLGNGQEPILRAPKSRLKRLNCIPEEKESERNNTRYDHHNSARVGNNNLGVVVAEMKKEKTSQLRVRK